MKKKHFLARILSLLNIADYYNDSEKSLRLFFSPKNPEYESRFKGYTKNEVEETLKLRLQELDRAALLSILTALDGNLSKSEG